MRRSGRRRAAAAILVLSCAAARLCFVSTEGKRLDAEVTATRPLTDR